MYDCSIRKQKCRVKSTTNGWQCFGQSEQRESSALFPIQSEKSPDSDFFFFFASGLWKKCFMPSARKHITEIKGEGMITGYEAHSDHLFWPHNRLSKAKSLQLNAHKGFSCLYTIFERHHIPEICLSVSHNYNQPGTMFPHLIREKYHQITLSLNNSRFLHSRCKLCWHSRFIKDLGCRQAVLKGTHRRRPSQQFLTSLWPGQRSSSISLSPNRFDSHKLLFEARDSSPPTSKLAICCLSVSSPRSMFHSFSQNETKYGNILGDGRLCQ